MSQRVSFIVTMVVLWTAGWASGQSQERWIFEGLITESDPVLAPDFQSGWVLSGSFLLDSLEMEEQFTSEDGRSGRTVGGISEAELTVDLYHQVLFEAFQQEGLIGYDFQDNNLEENGRDLFGWFFPLGGRLGETGWSSSWLQVWLMDPEGKMISHVPVKLSPYGIKWKSGWFRLTFVNEQGETVHADGRIELFCPEAQLDEQGDSVWKAVAADLSRQLLEKDSKIQSLEKELSDAKLRLDGLKSMVDLLVEERSNLQEDNALLKERADAADPEMVEKVAELTAERALMETQIADLTGKNEVLVGDLGRSEDARISLLSQIAQLEEQIREREAEIRKEASVSVTIDELIQEAALPPPPVQESIPMPIEEPVVPEVVEVKPVEILEPEPIVEEPVLISEPEPVLEEPAEVIKVEEVVEEPVKITEVKPEVEAPEPAIPEKKVKSWSVRKKGPRKFR